MISQGHDTRRPQSGQGQALYAGALARASLPSIYRRGEIKCSSSIDLRLKTNLATMLLDDEFGDGQAQAIAAQF